MLFEAVREMRSVEGGLGWRRRIAVAALCGAGVGFLWSHIKRVSDTSRAEGTLVLVSAAPQDEAEAGFVCSLRSFEPLIVVDGVVLSPGATAIDQTTVVSTEFMDRWEADCPGGRAPQRADGRPPPGRATHLSPP